jgi:hypothetical protein
MGAMVPAWPPALLAALRHQLLQPGGYVSHQAERHEQDDVYREISRGWSCYRIA